MKYFLVKTDPDTYSITDLEKDKKTLWDGVHNYEAINFIKTMKTGDMILIYHSQKDKAIVGVAKVISDPRVNTNDKRPSMVVDIEFVRKLQTPITLTEIKASNKFNKWKLVTHNRLSVMNVPDEFLSWIDLK